VDAVQSPGRNALADRAGADAEVDQVRVRDDAVLVRAPGIDRLINREAW